MCVCVDILVVLSTAVWAGVLTRLFCIHTDCSITKFLNRILGLEVHKQNHLFQYFMDNFDYLIEKDKKEGKYDMGILGTRPRHDGCQGGLIMKENHNHNYFGQC